MCFQREVCSSRIGSPGDASLFVSIADNRITRVIEKLNFKTFLTLHNDYSVLIECVWVLFL